MQGIKQCTNGHYYREDLEFCPICLDESNLEKKVQNNNTSIKEESSLFNFLKNKTFYLHFVLASFSTLILFYLLLIILNVYTLNGKEFELQNFQTFSVEQMRDKLNVLDLNYEITDSVYTDSVPRGTIFTQDPKPGTFVKSGRKIYFTVNCINRQKFELPDVFNKSEREAVNHLKMHFNVDFVKSDKYSEISSVVTKMKVGEAEVYPGQKLIEGTTITLYFGSGRSTNRIFVPNLIGVTKGEAEFILESINLKIGEIISEGEISDTLTAIISNQRPLSDSKLQSGDMIDIVITQLIDTLNIIDTTIVK